MLEVKAIYELGSILDNPIYEGFGIGDQPSLMGNKDRIDDFKHTYDPTLNKWMPPRLAPIWQPLKVIGRVKPFNDFPCVVIYPAFSERAVATLRDFLEPNGELLTLDSSVGNYFLYNCTNLVDIIDYKRSKIDFYSSGYEKILSIDHLVVHEDRLTSLSIFIMDKWPSMGRCFVTDVFARRVREAKLEGFNFRKIWPLPEHVHWEYPRKFPECHDELTEQPGVESRETIKGNSVILRLALGMKVPTEWEQKRFEEIADELDAMLVNPKKNAKYYGNLEVNEIVDGEARYFFSCPDADVLAKKLKPWLKKLDWPGQKWLIKRYGEFVDEQATSEFVNIS